MTSNGMRDKKRRSGPMVWMKSTFEQRCHAFMSKLGFPL
jgi:hypothetical protein